MAKYKGRCYDFARNGYCKYKNCKYSHGVDRAEPTERKKPELTSSERALRVWRDDILLKLVNVRPLKSRLGSFFKEARRLIDEGDGVCQEVIRALSTEGGLKRIQELIEYDYHRLTAVTRPIVFKTQMLPFLEIITTPNILESLILEQAVGTIYNVLFGNSGGRGVVLLGFLVDVLTVSDTERLTIETFNHLELSLLVFWQIIKLNSLAFVYEPFKPVAMKFEEILEKLHSEDTVNFLRTSRAYLDRILRHLNVGSSLPSVDATQKRIEKNHQPEASFAITHDPPGGRHDNDSADICEIQIMPTVDEILSSRSEYLPVKDPRQWHVGGISGLLDRNFRLLREDAVGQLRDTTYALLKPSNKIGGAQNRPLRTHIHRNVHVVALNFDRFTGLQFVAQVQQPIDMKRMSKRKREEWWQSSKRLQPGALVCLAFGAKNAVFCTVAGHSRARRSKNGEPPVKEMFSLSEEEKTATVLLELVQLSDNNVKCILSQYNSRTSVSAVSLIEFPGIILAAFEPTLRALQKMKRTNDLPFPMFLCPLDPESQWMIVPPPPTYALKNGFKFDLSCLLKDPTMSFTMRPNEDVDVKKLQEHSTLDNAQAIAVVNSLQRSVALIQGPPGTGKSYTGVALIKVLIQALFANRRRAEEDIGPIICVCYTNHALDQLLEDLLEKDITTQIVRIGSQSKSERLEQFNLRKISVQKNKTKTEKRDEWELHRDLDEARDQFNDLALESTYSESKIRLFLQRRNPQHYRQLYGTDEQGYKRAQVSHKGSVLKGWLKHGGAVATSEPRSVEALQEVHVDRMSKEERRMIHEHWVADIQRDTYDRASNILEQQRRRKVQFDNIRDELNIRCLRDAHVIGLTTTGLARNLNMLRRLRSKVVLCEEAGEVLESHLLTVLLPSVEHLILIGDHMQLRPQVQNYELSCENHNGGEQYSLDVSLFERLVNPDEGTGVQVPFSTLETQRRMHPSIAQLVRETLYPRLEDAPSVSQYPDVSGMRKRLFWLDHRHHEGDNTKNDALATSHWNSYEIDMTIALVNHLMRQGTYKSGEIAVLTPYLGQLHLLRNRLRDLFAITMGERDEENLDNAGLDDIPETQQRIVKTSLLQTLRVATIDNFQGEEAKVVVISLVRSNNQNRCGFLRTSNRINVLLSRAKHGMYIIGNSETSMHVPMWAQVIDILRQDGNLGTSLELQCSRHPDHPIAVSEPDDFVQYSPEGGCSQRCANRLKCGHACKKKCHSAILHDAVHCPEPCPRALKGCDHTCPRPCGDPCPDQCTVNVHQTGRRLPCGHLAEDFPCWQSQDVSLVTCLEPVERQMPGCGHRVTVQCRVDVTKSEYRCFSPCKANLPCGHVCKRECWKCTVRTLDGADVNHGICLQVCGRNQSTCVHACSQTCHGSEPCPPCSMPCEVQCAHSKCPRLCAEPCAPCAVSPCLSSCPHSQCSMPCAAPCDHIPCSRRCEKLLSCGHRCPSVCGEVCPPSEFCQQCANPEVKERVVDFILSETYAEINLDENPCVFPRCGHFLTIESMDGQMDMKKYYQMESDRPVAIRSSSEPFSVDDIKRCATCRGSLRDVSRYGRLVRRAILDESTKRFLLYLNREYLPLAQELPLQLAALRENEGALSRLLLQGQDTIKISGSRDKQFRQMLDIIQRYQPNRWKGVCGFRNRIVKYYNTVEEEEQPFTRVQALVESARRHKRTSGIFEFDGSIVQTKGVFLATALLIRLDIGLLGDFLSLYERGCTGATRCKLQINLQATREECRALIKRAGDAMRVAHEAEGWIFLAQLHALERSYSISDTPTASERQAEQARQAIASARQLCHRNPGQTSGLESEIGQAETMLRNGTFYSAVTSEERMGVITAMAREFRGTGHWYYCQNGHPFTIGECGGAMQLATCPECGARVGGQHHRTADGVTRADDLEQELGRLSMTDT